jgi:hypothetical protein
MKALTPQELRIGNMILDCNKKVRTVLQLFGDSYQCDGDNGHRYSYTYQYSSGIPLTEEWLQRFGFTIHSDYSYRNYALPNHHFIVSVWLGEGQPGGFEKPGAVYWGDSFGEIQFVHQLQNLFFALTGEELTISSSNLERG